jgi:uncharacterized protein YdiU (UPF0061 family)
MARHVNSQYRRFKQNLQNKFAERYRKDTTPQYSQQDVEHLKLIQPEIPEPVVPAARHFRSFSSRRRPAQQVNLDEFEQEYQNFINMLKANKKAQEEAVQEQVEPAVEETTPTVEETVAEDVIETPVIETKPLKKKKTKQVEVQTEAPAYPDDGKSEGEKSELPMFDLS